MVRNKSFPSSFFPKTESCQETISKAGHVTILILKMEFYFTRKLFVYLKCVEPVSDALGFPEVNLALAAAAQRYTDYQVASFVQQIDILDFGELDLKNILVK